MRCDCEQSCQVEIGDSIDIGLHIEHLVEYIVNKRVSICLSELESKRVRAMSMQK